MTADLVTKALWSEQAVLFWHWAEMPAWYTRNLFLLIEPQCKPLNDVRRWCILALPDSGKCYQVTAKLWQPRRVFKVHNCLTLCRNPEFPLVVSPPSTNQGWTCLASIIWQDWASLDYPASTTYFCLTLLWRKQHTYILLFTSFFPLTNTVM